MYYSKARKAVTSAVSPGPLKQKMLGFIPRAKGMTIGDEVVNGESSAGKVASQLLTSQIVNRLVSAIPSIPISGTFSTAIGKTIALIGSNISY